MAWTRVNVLAEGHTEVQFIKAALAPHFAELQTEVVPMMVISSRQRNDRGGVQSYARVRNDIDRLLRSQPNAHLSTMFDLFQLPSSFPGMKESTRLRDGAERAHFLEEALRRDIGSSKFIPYIQVHEFETLLFVDLDVLKPRISNSRSGIEALKAEVARLEPEAINGGPQTAPSKRLIKHIPAYKRNKRRVGALAAASIPLSKLRKRCPHFGAWMTQLETL